MLNQALARDPSFFAAQCQLANAHDQLYAVGVDHTPEPACLSGKPRLRPPSSCGLMPAKRISPAPIISIPAYRDYDGALAELDIVRGTMPNSPRDLRIDWVSSRAGEARTKKDCAIFSAQWHWIRETSSPCSSSHSATEFCVAMLTEIATRDRVLSIKPDDAETKANRALALLDWKADTRPLHQTIDEIRAKNPEAVKNVADVWFLCALAERDAAAAEQCPQRTWLTPPLATDAQVQFSAAFGRGLLARMMKDENKARSAFAAIRPEQEKIVQATARLWSGSLHPGFD